MKKHLIVGNGGAAISAVTAIRSINSDDEITIISKENCLAYSPALTTYYLSGNIGYADMFICDEMFYRQKRVNTLLARRVVKVDPKLRKVYTDGGELRKYDDLLIATGSSSIVPSIEGVNLPGVFTLYTADDAKRIISFFEGKETVAIIGAGLIGIQVLGALITRGKKVFLVEMMDQILPQILDPQGARILEERLRQKGVDIRLSEPVLGIYDNNGKKVIWLAPGAELTVDAVILAVGVYPNVDFLQDSGIEFSSGVIVDEHCRASTDGVYAAGDVAEAPDAVTGRHVVNATWPNAIEQGRVAGLNMAGKEVSILRNRRFNAFSLFGFPCVSLGLIRAEGMELDEIVSQDNVSYRKLFFKEGLLVGSVLLGETEDAGIIVSLIERRGLSPHLYEALLSHSVCAHSIRYYYWSILFKHGETTRKKERRTHSSCLLGGLPQDANNHAQST